MKKYCTRCGRQFESVGREVICPDCKAAAEEESKKAAVLRAKRASWSGESVPVRISGRASTIIRRYGAANNLPFAESLDALLKSTDYFKSVGTKWEEVEPYRSHRRDKHTTETEDMQEAQVAKQAGKVTTSTTAKKTASKAVKTSKAKKVTA